MTRTLIMNLTAAAAFGSVAIVAVIFLSSDGCHPTPNVSNATPVLVVEAPTEPDVQEPDLPDPCGLESVLCEGEEGWTPEIK